MSETSERESQSREDSRPTDEIIATALTKNVDADGDDYWNLIWILQTRLPAILSRVMELVSSNHPKARDLAATILGQNGRKEKVISGLCVSLLTSMLLTETSSDVQVSIIFALGHHHDPSCLRTLLQFETHPDSDVRYALTHSLCSLEEDSALGALCRLSHDQDTGVRSWATFAIGTLTDKKNALIHDALVARLGDEDDEVRGEALVGLSERCEVCVAPAFLLELEKSSPESLRDWILIQDAAAAVEKCHRAEPKHEWEMVLAKLKEIGIPARAAE